MSDTSNPAAGDNPQLAVIRKRLTETEVTPAGTRYDATCDCVQMTTDGGTTWVDNPGLDPRKFDGYRLPARTGSDPQCNAAANMLAKLKLMVDVFEQDIAVFQAVSGLLAIILVFLGGAGILIDLFLAIAEFLVTLGADAISTAFTDEQWALIECILFCDIGLDGQVSETQYNKIIADIHAQCSTVVYDVMFTLLPAIGWVGLSNAGATGTETGDCSACDCQWCYRFQDGTGFDTDWTVEYWTVSGCGAAAVFSGGVWNSTVNPPSGGACGGHTVTYLHLRKVLAGTIHLTDAALHISDTGYNRTIWVNGDGSLFSGTEIWDGAFLPTAPIATDSIDILCFLVDVDGAFTVDWAQFSGNDDTNPFGDNNC